MKVANIAKNTSFFTFALIIQKVISFSYFTILARNLNPADLGKFYLAISITTIFAIIIDIGLANVLTREISKTFEASEKNGDTKRRKYLASVILIKIILAFLTCLLVVIFAQIMAYPELVKQLVYISILAMVLDSFTMTFWAYMRGFHVLKYESVGVVLFQLIVFSLGLTVLHFDLGLKPLMSVMVLASVANFAFSATLTKFKFETSILPSFDKIIVGHILALSIPFALYAILQRVYMYLDSVLLSSLAGDEYVGLYQIAFKIIFALQFLPMAFIASLYPAFALYYKENKEQLVISFERAINYLVIISLPIALGVIALADKIILIFKAEYTDAILPLQIVMLSLPFLFINFPIGSLMNACDRQKRNTIHMALVLVLSVLLNLVLIPKYQAIGASITVLISNFFMFILGIVVVPSIAKIRLKKVLPTLFKALVAVLAMFSFAYYMKENIFIFINITISAIIYVGTLFVLKGFSKDDIGSVLKSLKK